VEEAARSAGARDVMLLEEPMAAAIGAGLNVWQAKGCMVVDIGGGTTEIAVIALNGIVASRSLRIGGNHMDEAIMRQLRKAHGLIVGESTAEMIKITMGFVMDRGRERTMEVRGRDVETGLPKSIMVDSQSISEALMEPAQAIVDAVKSVLERTPPELAADIINEGIVMTGGGSLLHGLNRMIARATGMPVRRAEHPIDVVAIGAGLALEMREPRIFERELSAEPG